jgi:hypothetical protein
MSAAPLGRGGLTGADSKSPVLCVDIEHTGLRAPTWRIRRRARLCPKCMPAYVRRPPARSGRKLLTSSGPGYLVAVGYMDPWRARRDSNSQPSDPYGLPGGQPVTRWGLVTDTIELRVIVDRNGISPVQAVEQAITRLVATRRH